MSILQWSSIFAICEPWHWNLGIGIEIGNGIGIGTDITNAIVSSSCLRTPNLAGWWLRMRGPHQQSHVTFRYRGHMTNINVISQLSQDLWILNLAGWWLRMRETHPKSHVTHWSRSHVTSQRRYISNFTKPMDPKLSRVT